MTVLQELLVKASTANEEQLARALAAMDRNEIEHPLDGCLSMAAVLERYSVSRSTVYRKNIPVAKKIGGEVYFRESDVVRTFDPGALKVG